MGNSYRVGFKSVLGHNDLFHYRDFELKFSEIYVLWRLGLSPNTSYGIFKNKEKFPYPADAIAIPNEEMLKLKEQFPSFDRSTIDDAVRNLEQKELVKIYDFIVGDRFAGLSFSGLIWFLQNSRREYIEQMLHYYFKLSKRPTSNRQLISEEYELIMPFLPLWKSMIYEFGAQYCLDRLEKTAKDFFAVKEVELKNVGGMDVNGYLLLPPPEWLKKTQPDYYHSITQRRKGQRNAQVVAFLKRPDSALLLNSYIAYLAIHDLTELSKDTLEQPIEKQSDSFAEKELAYFEKGNAERTPLLSRDILIEYFPKYAAIQYVFTGMFVESLMWDSE